MTETKVNAAHETDAAAMSPAGPLKGVRVLDLSRILAGPSCTQLLGDLGADIIKIEKPREGDDTRGWGPPFVIDGNEQETRESAYYLCANRNKRSVAVDISQPKGAELIRSLAQHCDVLIENFKVDGLAQYGLSYSHIQPLVPTLIYCSVTGFGQTGPYAGRAGYDFMIQGMGGIMSLTGETDGEPQKVGVGIADVMCGMYATVAIVAALRDRDRTGIGQHIDVSLLDSQIAWLVNGGTNYLTSGNLPKRYGNAHPNIVPYQTFGASDGHFILAVGNDSQFAKFCRFANAEDLASSPDYATNAARVRNRRDLVQKLAKIIRQRPVSDWISGLEQLGVPVGPVNNLEQVFADQQVIHRGMKISMPHPVAKSGAVSLIGNPIKYSRSPVTYRYAPPLLGQHTDEVLEEILGMHRGERDELRRGGIIEPLEGGK